MNSSSHAILILSHVAGASSWNIEDNPRSVLAAIIASLMAKNTDEARNRGGSPIPFEE